MDFLERDLEEIIFNSDADLLHDRGFYFYHNKKIRQFTIPGYGTCDIVTMRRPFCEFGRIMKGEITIHELKKDKIGVSTFFQALRYSRGIQRYLERMGKEDLYNISIVLMGSKLDMESSFVFLPSLFPKTDLIERDESLKCSVSLFTYKYEIDGIHFKEHDEYFSTSEAL